MSHPADVPTAPDLQRFLDEEATSEALAHLLEKPWRPGRTAW